MKKIFYVTIVAICLVLIWLSLHWVNCGGGSSEAYKFGTGILGSVEFEEMCHRGEKDKVIEVIDGYQGTATETEAIGRALARCIGAYQNELAILIVERYSYDNNLIYEQAAGCGNYAIAKYAVSRGAIVAREDATRLFTELVGGNKDLPVASSPFIPVEEKWSFLMDFYSKYRAYINVNDIHIVSGFAPYQYYVDPPLHHAVQGNNLELVRFLIDAGANVNNHDAYGATPLIRAVQSPWNDRIPIISELLKHGANIDIQDSSGKTVMDHLAANRRHTAREIEQYIKTYRTR